MHAWAEIEHKLQYKSISAAPDQFKRQLFRLSAKFEEADEQFESIRQGVEMYRDALHVRANTFEAFRREELNAESLNAFAEIAITGKGLGRIESFSRDFVKYSAAGLSMSEIVDAFIDGKDYVKIAEEYHSKRFGAPVTFGIEMTMDFILQIACEKYRTWLKAKHGGSYAFSPDLKEARLQFEQSQARK